MPLEADPKRPPVRSEWLRELRDQVATYFANKGLPVRRTAPYILAGGKQSWRLNIIDPKVLAMVRRTMAERRAQGYAFPLHRWARHGLSSQALLFNLIGPVLLARRWDAFDIILESAGIPLSGLVSDAILEQEDRSIFDETQGQPTSVDLYLETDQGERVFVEFKFTETGFGGCSIFERGNCDGRNPASDYDLCYLHAIGRKYWVLMEEQGLITKTLHDQLMCPFVGLYQAYRILMFALAREGHFLLICDERNPSLEWTLGSVKRGALPLFRQLLPASAERRCHRITTQEVLEVLEGCFPFPSLPEVKAKYF